MSTLKLIERRLKRGAKSLPTHGVRMALFHAKRAVGASTRSDRSFLVNELARMLDAGLVGDGLYVMATGRVDGAGAQATAKMSAMALARHYGLTYVHTPFQTMEHAENGSPALWAAAWENIFNLGNGELSADACGLPQVGIEEFIGNRLWWNKPCLLAAGHYARFTDSHPEAYARISEELRAKYRRTRTEHQAHREIVVCAHLRRGDVSAADPDTANRAPDYVSFLNCLRQVQGALAATGLAVRTKIISQGDARGLELLQAMGCELNLNTPAIDSFHQMVDADVLVMGRSSFSFAAALLGEGLRIYDPCARAPVPGWLVRSPEGFVDGSALAWGVTGIAARLRAANKGLARAG
ncbi:MAG: hypothetical protein EKK41_14115 [Hyphomicrobiales bacterium]|nr:MAG: hypothetical protein EKK41_14115 [Hyphomicrobiales bacterium]